MVFTIMMTTALAEQIVEAAKNGDIETVKTILAGDASKLNALDEEKYTPLHWACIRGYWEVVRYLVEQGADLNMQGGDGGTPLNWAVHHDNVSIAKLMIDKGAKLNIQNQWGMTELHTAIWRGNIHVVDYLLDQGSDPMIKTKEGWTAMHYAFRSGHDNVIELLKKKGVSLRVQDKNGRYPQHLYFKKPLATCASSFAPPLTKNLNLPPNFLCSEPNNGLTRFTLVNRLIIQKEFNNEFKTTRFKKSSFLIFSKILLCIILKTSGTPIKIVTAFLRRHSEMSSLFKLAG